ncbi:hypothetical protein ACOQFV_23840 [Nocardiopsis changdeensis]|uniref:Uncharacterized protein n=1 Tax=Nocardiopsis changdeensis TaxID=2831969 RepID=A0ABX8BNJ0_9ACTN|nr:MULTISPECIES: hypothetical protein [Nocardiopsis]QUX23809.1 hypothetical protein KGD84_05605 [Nocardiopsis changdeensis]QYX39754.1 hypothetical protein K1J57_15060 [Nocardiopsis sp. MT53]
MRTVRSLLPATAAVVLTLTACTQGAAAPAAETSAEPAEEVPTALEVMAPVIEEARNTPVRGDVWNLRTDSAEAWGVGPEDDRYGVYDIYHAETWSWVDEYDLGTGRSEGGEEWGLHARRTDATTWKLLNEDAWAAWERDGSPVRWEPGPEGERPDIPTQEEGFGELSGPHPGGWDFGLGTVDHQGLQEASPDPEDLEEMLFPASEPMPDDPAEQGPDGIRHPSTTGSGYGSEEARRFSYVSRSLHLPFPPEVRAGMYTLLAGLPGVRPLEAVRDVSGRSAVGVAYTLDPTDIGTVEHRVLFDPATGRLLSQEHVVVEPAASAADWCEPGDVVKYTLYEFSMWIDGPPL